PAIPSRHRHPFLDPSGLESRRAANELRAVTAGLRVNVTEDDYRMAASRRCDGRSVKTPFAEDSQEVVASARSSDACGTRRLRRLEMTACLVSKLRAGDSGSLGHTCSGQLFSSRSACAEFPRYVLITRADRLAEPAGAKALTWACCLLKRRERSSSAAERRRDMKAIPSS